MKDGKILRKWKKIQDNTSSPIILYHTVPRARGVVPRDNTEGGKRDERFDFNFQLHKIWVAPLDMRSSAEVGRAVKVHRLVPTFFASFTSTSSLRPLFLLVNLSLSILYLPMITGIVLIDGTLFLYFQGNRLLGCLSPHLSHS